MTKNTEVKDTGVNSTVITLQLNEQEATALIQLIDSGVKQLGIHGVQNAAFFLQKLSKIEDK